MTQLLQSYLFAWLFCAGIALGSFAILAIHGLTGGRWGEPLRAPLLAAVGTLPWTALLFLPVLVGAPLLFPWSGGGGSIASWLNVPFFAVRAVIYLGCWSALAVATTRRGRVPRPAPSLILFAVTMTFASWDWMMSLEPEWTSTIYAMSVMTGEALAGLATAILVAFLFRSGGEGAPLRDVGNLLLATLMLWAYLVFSQFLIVFSGNRTPEIAWYLKRMETSWVWFAVAILVLAFFAPFLMLLFRAAKERPKVLAWIAAGIVAMHAVELFWTIAPAFHPGGIFVSWLDVVALLAIGAAWVALLRWRLGAEGARVAERA